MCNQLSHIYQEPLFKEMAVSKKHYCQSCKRKFNHGERYAKDSDLTFCQTCVKDGSADKFLENDLEFTLCQIYNVTMNECEILK